MAANNKLGRPRIEIPDSTVAELMEGRGLTQVEAAEELGVSLPTMARIIADVQAKQGIILKYRPLQSLQLTAIQARILDKITPEKIDMASLSDLVRAFAILKKSEMVLEGKPGEVKGLVALLVQMEREETALATVMIEQGQGQGNTAEQLSQRVIDITSESESENGMEDDVPDI